MKHRISCLIVLLCVAFATYAEDWYTITSSGQYYYGEGIGTTEEEAGKAALENLLRMVAEDVVDDFKGISGANESGHREKVEVCLRTYQPAFVDPLVQTMKVSQRPNVVVRKWMKRSELERIYEGRIYRLKNMVRQANEALERGSVDVALQYYYWSYALLRSLQYPDKVTDSKGRALMGTLSAKIEQMLKHIRVEYVGRENIKVDDETRIGVDLRVTYKGNPTTVDFTYDDGKKQNCDGRADGGNAYMELQSGYDEAAGYRLWVEYEYRNWARGDVEMRNVLTVVPSKRFPNEFSVGAKAAKPKAVEKKAQVAVAKAAVNSNLMANAKLYADRINEVLDALRNQLYDKAYGYISSRGLKVNNFVRLVSQRNGRLLGTPTLTLYPGANGDVVVRGAKMAFSVTERGRKTTLVDDVIFTFDKDMMISNLTFGIGNVAQNDLLCKNVTWGEDTRQMVMDFLENYKTAYCLKDIDYIEAVFDDNATIIVGSVAKRTTRPGIPENQMSEIGREYIKYKKYTKSEYLENLRKTFARNQFVNIKFTNNDVQLLENVPGQVFAIQIGQEYTSSTYADQGFLFLLVDMTDKTAPLIKIRTWQPKPDPEFGLYGPGHFFYE